MSLGSAKSRRIPLEQSLAKIRQVVETGARSVGEISEKTGFRESTIRNYAKKGKIPLPSKETLRNYRVEPESFHDQRAKILSVLEQRALQLASAEGWATQKATEYFLTSPGHCPTRTFENLVLLFQRYENASNNGEKLSYSELGEGIFPTPIRAGIILREMNLPALHGNYKKRNLSKETQRALKRAIKTEMPVSDLAYFLKAHYPKVSQQVRMWHINLERRYALTPSQNHPMSYRVASQIYEAKDLKFTPQETAYLLDLPASEVKAALKERPRIEEKIREVLNLLYPEKNIQKPYL